MTLKTLKQELNVLAGKYLDRPEAKTAIDRINKSIDKARISVGKTSFKYKEFEE
jgi:cell division GTPase FtsZ